MQMVSQRQSSQEQEAQLIVRVPLSTRKAIRVRAAEEDTSVQKIVNDLLIRYLEEHRQAARATA